MSPRLHADSRTAAPGAHGQAMSRWAANRRPYIDNLKIILIAAIIAIHGVLGYAHLVGRLWPYANVQEVRLAESTETTLLVVIAPFAVFMIALLFLMAGLLTPSSVEHKGPGRYIRGRLLRLGVPFAAFTLVLWPVLLYYALYHPLGHAHGSYWAEFVGADAVIDFGPFWFVGVLLIFSVTYGIHAAVRRSRPARPARPVHRELSMRRLVLLSAAVAVATFAVRLIFPLGSERFPDLNLWEWPACAGLFGLGIIASGQGWLDAVPGRIRRRSRDVTVLAMLAMAAIALLVTVAEIPGGTVDDLAGGVHWPALAFAMVEAPLTVFGSVWLLAVSQRHLDQRIRLGPVLARSAYGAFILQGPVLIGLAVALRPVPVPAELKALIVATGGVCASFMLAWLLISRIPALSRML